MMPGTPCDGWLGKFAEVFEGRRRRPDLILMSALFWHDYTSSQGGGLYEDGDGVNFRGVEVIEDIDCPGVWMGDDIRNNTIPLEPYDPQRIASASEDRIEVKIAPIEEAVYRPRVGPQIPIRRGESREGAMLRRISELEGKLGQVRNMIPALDDREATKGVARKLRSILE